MLWSIIGDAAQSVAQNRQTQEDVGRDKTPLVADPCSTGSPPAF
jgi:hypothetical protein